MSMTFFDKKTADANVQKHNEQQEETPTVQNVPTEEEKPAGKKTDAEKLKGNK